MSYIIISSKNKRVVERLNKLEFGRIDGSKKGHDELFVEAFNLGNNNKRESRTGTVKVMRNNGIVWSYIAALFEEFPLEIDVFIAESVMKHQLPKVFRTAGKWLSEKKGRQLRGIPAAIKMTEEELKKHFIDVDKELKIEGREK